MDLPFPDPAFRKTLQWRVQSSWSRPRRRTKSPDGRDAIYAFPSCQKVAQLFFNCPDFLQADENNQEQALQETAEQMDLGCPHATGEAGTRIECSHYVTMLPYGMSFMSRHMPNRLRQAQRGQ